MKRTQKLLVIATIATLTLGSAMSVSAETAKAPLADKAVSTPAPKASEAPTATPAAPVATPAPIAATEEKFEDLKVIMYSFKNEQAAVQGEIPRIPDMADLTKKIYNDVWKAYTRSEADVSYNNDLRDERLKTVIENKNRYVKITVTTAFGNHVDSLKNPTTTFTYYVDKKGLTEITAADFDAKTAPAKVEAVAVNVAKEELMVPLRSNLETLGYTLAWDAKTSTIIVSRDTKEIARLSIGDANVTMGDKSVILTSAPVNKDGVTFVPASFFEKVLGIYPSADPDGKVTFKVLEAK